MCSKRCPSTVGVVFELHHQLPEWHSAAIYFQKAEANLCTVICRDNHPLAFDINQMPYKGHQRESEETHRQTKIVRIKEQHALSERLIQSRSQLAVFQVITQVLSFYFSLTLLLPREVTLPAHTYNI